jgi:hypothetical protein
MNSVFKMACKIYSDTHIDPTAMGSKSVERGAFQAKILLTL